MTRILFIQPPVCDFYITEDRLNPLGLSSICSYLEERGIATRIFDCLKNSRRELKLPGNFPSGRIVLANREDRNPFNFFSRYFQFGNTDGLYETVKDFSPDVIGISMNFSAYSSQAGLLLEELKSRFADMVYIAGGWHMTYLKERAFELYPQLDYVVSGPGEKPVHDLVRFLEDGKDSFPACVYARNMAGNPDGEEWSDEFYRTRSFKGDYRIFGKPSHTLIVSRGCPNSCSFCVLSVYGKNAYSKRNLSEVIDELNQAYSRGIRTFNFEDDNLTADREYFSELLGEISLNFKDIRLFAMNGIEFGTLDAELIRRMKAAGFNNLNLSLAIKSDTVQKTMCRPSNTEKLAQVVTDSVLAGLNTTVYFICGSSDTELEEVIETIFFLASLPVLIGISIFYKVPGTDSFDPEKDEFSLCRGTAMKASAAWATPEVLNELFMITRMINFLKDFIDRGGGVLPEQTPGQKPGQWDLQCLAAGHLLTRGDNVRIRLERSRTAGPSAASLETYPNKVFRKYFHGRDLLISGYKTDATRKIRDYIA